MLHLVAELNETQSDESFHHSVKRDASNAGQEVEENLDSVLHKDRNEEAK